MLSKPQRDQRVQALTRIAVATREKIDPAVYVLFVEDTAHVRLEVFLLACRRLERNEWFPKVATLLEECRIVANQLDEQEREKRPKLANGDRPVDPQRWARFKDDVEACVRRKHSMPKVIIPEEPAE